MKKTLLVASLLLLGLILSACNSSESTGEARPYISELTTPEQETGYAIGLDVANSLSRFNFTFDNEGLLKGMGDKLTSAETEITAEQQAEIMQTVQGQMMERMQDTASEAAVLDRQSCYALGMDIHANYLSRLPTEFDNNALLQGLHDAITKSDSLMTQTEVTTTLAAFRERAMAEQQRTQATAATENKAAGAAFLAENAKKDGVVETDSGLQYKVIKKGDGAKPKATDTVEVHYQGTLIDGTEFDSSYSRNETIEFPLNGVISGWTEGLQLMSVGSKYELYIPSDLAYGDAGRGATIQPGATLVFVVELISIK